MLIGDLGDVNAIGRRDGFEAAVKDYRRCGPGGRAYPDRMESGKGARGVDQRAAGQSRDQLHFQLVGFPFPFGQRGAKSRRQIQESRAKPGHVLLGGFDGDPTAYQMLVDGYLDADGVQDVYFEAKASVEALLDMRAGKTVAAQILDPGFRDPTIQFEGKAPQMWGARIER